MRGLTKTITVNGREITIREVSVAEIRSWMKELELDETDVMDVALEGYALVKVSGRAQGLDELRRELGGRFAKTRRKEPAPA